MTAVALDPDWLPSEALYQIAERVRTAYDIDLPSLPNWNSGACLQHGGLIMGPAPGCHKCGVRPRRHQRIGITWLYLTKRAGLFDSTGLGKTVQVAGLLALMQNAGKLNRKVLIICRAATIGQWQAELARMIPSLLTVTVTGTARERGAKLARPWEAAICGPEMLVSKVAKGLSQLEQFDIGTVICDDIEALKNVNKTSSTIKKLCQQADRVVIASATPLDKRLSQLYDLGTILGWDAVFGQQEEFLHRYVRQEKTWYAPKLKPVVCRNCRTWMRPDFRRHVWVDNNKQDGPCPKTGQLHMPLSRYKPEFKCNLVEIGPVQERLPEFRAKIAPLVLRRAVADCDDANMPEVESSQIWLDLGAAQQARYAEIKHGILTRQNEDGQVSRQDAGNAWLRAWQVTSGLANLDNCGITGESVKLDWAVEALTGDLSDEPVVVYCYFRPTLADLAGRLAKAGVSTARIWGEQDAASREADIAAFNSGRARVILITDAGGAGLNLQKARRLILVDTPRSAARVTQIVGRIRRDGSAHQTAYVTQLLTNTPIERELAQMITREALVSAQVLDRGELAGEFAPVDMRSLVRAVTG
jgi:hypothetical protein